MMSAFLLGLLVGLIAPCSFMAWYYIRARRRVNSIKLAIENYQKASKVVGSVCEEVFSKK